MEISRIYEESWRAAYQNILPQDYLDAIPAGNWVPYLTQPERKLLVCTQDGRMVGTSSFGPSRIKQYSGWGEVYSLYLLPGCVGKGYGKALMQRSICELQKLGFQDIFLWVLEENKRAIRFYERFGFLPATDFLEDTIGGKALREVRYIYRG